MAAGQSPPQPSRPPPDQIARDFPRKSREIPGAARRCGGSRAVPALPHPACPQRPPRTGGGPAKSRESCPQTSRDLPPFSPPAAAVIHGEGWDRAEARTTNPSMQSAVGRRGDGELCRAGDAGSCSFHEGVRQRRSCLRRRRRRRRRAASYGRGGRALPAPCLRPRGGGGRCRAEQRVMMGKRRAQR